MSYRIARLNIPYNEIRSLVLEYLKSNPSTQYLSICSGVAQIAVNRKIVPHPHPGIVYGATYDLQNLDGELVREIIWDLRKSEKGTVLFLKRNACNGRLTANKRKKLTNRLAASFVRKPVRRNCFGLDLDDYLAYEIVITRR